MVAEQVIDMKIEIEKENESEKESENEKEYDLNKIEIEDQDTTRKMFIKVQETIDLLVGTQLIQT